MEEGGEGGGRAGAEGKGEGRTKGGGGDVGPGLGERQPGIDDH